MIAQSDSSLWPGVNSRPWRSILGNFPWLTTCLALYTVRGVSKSGVAPPWKKAFSLIRASDAYGSAWSTASKKSEAASKLEWDAWKNPVSIWKRTSYLWIMTSFLMRSSRDLTSKFRRSCEQLVYKENCRQNWKPGSQLIDHAPYMASFSILGAFVRSRFCVWNEISDALSVFLPNNAPENCVFTNNVPRLYLKWIRTRERNSTPKSRRVSLYSVKVIKVSRITVNHFLVLRALHGSPRCRKTSSETDCTTILSL